MRKVVDFSRWTEAAIGSVALPLYLDAVRRELSAKVAVGPIVVNAEGGGIGFIGYAEPGEDPRWAVTTDEYEVIAVLFEKGVWILPTEGWVKSGVVEQVIDLVEAVDAGRTTITVSRPRLLRTTVTKINSQSGQRFVIASNRWWTRRWIEED